MKTNGFRMTATVLVMAAAMMPTAVLAQDDDAHEFEVRGKRIVIERGSDGRIVVDGKIFSEDDGPIILRVRPEGGEVEVERMGPSGIRLRNRLEARSPRGASRVFFRDPDGGRDFSMHAPHLSLDMPMIEEFAFELGDQFRANAEEHRAVAELERESREIAREARRADRQDRARFEADLRTKLNDIFEKKMAIRSERVAHLENQFRDEQEKLQKRSAARDQLIERRLRELMGEGDLMDW